MSAKPGCVASPDVLLCACCWPGGPDRAGRHVRGAGRGAPLWALHNGDLAAVPILDRGSGECRWLGEAVVWGAAPWGTVGQGWASPGGGMGTTGPARAAVHPEPIRVGGPVPCTLCLHGPGHWRASCLGGTTSTAVCPVPASLPGTAHTSFSPPVRGLGCALRPVQETRHRLLGECWGLWSQGCGCPGAPGRGACRGAPETPFPPGQVTRPCQVQSPWRRSHGPVQGSIASMLVLRALPRAGGCSVHPICAGEWGHGALPALLGAAAATGAGAMLHQAPPGHWPGCWTPISSTGA